MTSELPEAIAVTTAVTSVLESLGVPYVVAGSLASSFHGFPRATADADIVALLARGHVERFAAALEADFMVDREMIRNAIVRRFEFNVLHLATMFKVDVFVPPIDNVLRSQLARGERIDVGHDASFVVASAEDTIAQKLRWYRLGGHVSERQWNDARGIVEVGGAKLDRDYLHTTASALGVADLLVRLLDGT